MASNEGNNISEGPSITADTWFAFAVSGFLITLVIGAIAAYWVFIEEDPAKMVQRAQAFTPFGAALLAIVTFCTVAWRGEMNRQQLDQQIRQNDSNDDANYAKLLQEGAKLLGEADNQSHQLAGIATLETLLTDPKKRFAIEAMDLLADYVAVAHKFQGDRRRYRAAARALNKGASLGVRSRVDLDFIAEDGLFSWIAINGLNSSSYQGGVFGKREFGVFSTHEKVRFTQCSFKGIRVQETSRFSFSLCTFSYCRIEYFEGESLSENKFHSCSFTSATISEPFISAIKLGDGSARNFVMNGQYPNCPTTVEWSAFLQNREDDPTGLWN